MNNAEVNLFFRPFTLLIFFLSLQTGPTIASQRNSDETLSMIDVTQLRSADRQFQKLSALNFSNLVFAIRSQLGVDVCASLRSCEGALIDGKPFGTCIITGSQCHPNSDSGWKIEINGSFENAQAFWVYTEL